MAFFKGINECAHRVHEYNDTKFGVTVVVDVTGLDNQALPSPPMMAPYEDAPPNSCPSDYILKHQLMEGVSIPDATGARVRVRGYGRVLRLTYMNTIRSRVFLRSTHSYVETPVSIRMAVLSMRDEMIFDRGKLFFRSNNKFQNEATRKYHPFNNNVTKSLFMGFVGIDKGKTDGAGAVVLDLLLKSGTMTEESIHR